MRMASGIVRHRKAVLALAGLLLVLGLFGMLNTGINYDLLSYLPEDLDSVKGFAILNEDFALGNTAQVMLVGASDRHVRRLTDEMSGIEGIERVTWVDDLGDLAVPREFWSNGLADAYFSEDATFFQVSFTASANDPLTRSAVEEMREILGDEQYYLAGTQQLELEDVMNADRTRLAAAALVLVSIALLLTVPSVIVPVLFVLTIGLAVVYNLGLSFYLGQQISYLTGVIVFALQFAVTMDYALFLYHRYEQERARFDNETAMATAIAATFRSVVAAAATTIAGFLALASDAPRIRGGHGAHARPGRCHHRGRRHHGPPRAAPDVRRSDTPLRAQGTPARFPPARGMALQARTGDDHRVPAGVRAGGVDLLAARAQLRPRQRASRGSPLARRHERLAEEFGRAQSFFIVVEDTGRVADLDMLSRSAREIEGVSDVVSFSEAVSPLIPAEFLPAEAREAFFEGDYTYVSVSVPFDFSDPRTEEVIEELRGVSEGYPGRAYVTGQSVLFGDLEETSKGDVSRVNWISIVSIAIIVAIVFRSLAVPVLLLASIQLAILLNQGIAAMGENDVIFIATLAIGAIQLGATVDYAIILTTRYEEELGRAGHREEAMREALGGTAPSILVSASTMFAATIGLVFLSSISTITDLTLLIARGAVISFAVVVFLLPSLLVVAQPVLERASIGWPKLPRK
jgi:uncharacterized protein